MFSRKYGVHVLSGFFIALLLNGYAVAQEPPKAETVDYKFIKIISLNNNKYNSDCCCIYIIYFIYIILGSSNLLMNIYFL